MSVPYFPPPPTQDNHNVAKRKRLSFPALPSPSDALTQVSKSRLALHKRIFANKFASSNPEQQRKDIKNGISRPITSPTRAKPPVNMLTTGSGRLVAVGLPSSPRMPPPPKSPPPPKDQVGDLSVYSAFDPRPLPGPPPVVRESYGSYHTAYEQPRQMTVSYRQSFQPVRSIEEEYYTSTMLPPPVQQPSGSRTRKQPPKAIQLPTKAESQWEVTSAPPVMYPQQEEVPVHLDMSPAFAPWERPGGRRAREY